jgi:hypothetical protein
VARTHQSPATGRLLREQPGARWRLLADSAEFHAYLAPLAEILAETEQSDTGSVGGLMLDRLAADGALTGWDPAEGLDAAYPLGAFVTHRLLRGDRARSCSRTPASRSRPAPIGPRSTATPTGHRSWSTLNIRYVAPRGVRTRDGSSLCLEPVSGTGR